MIFIPDLVYCLLQQYRSLIFISFSENFPIFCKIGTFTRVLFLLIISYLISHLSILEKVMFYLFSSSNHWSLLHHMFELGEMLPFNSNCTSLVTNSFSSFYHATINMCLPTNEQPRRLEQSDPSHKKIEGCTEFANGLEGEHRSLMSCLYIEF